MAITIVLAAATSPIGPTSLLGPTSIFGPTPLFAQEDAADEAQRPRDSASPPDSLQVHPEGELIVGDIAVRCRAGRFLVDLSIDNLFNQDVVEMLDSGVPATILIDVELWRERGIWFDSFEGSHRLVFRIRHDVWDDAYEVLTTEGGIQASAVFATLEEVEAIVGRPSAIPVKSCEALEPERDYYMVVSAALKPMTLDDVAELESWLSGDLKQGRRSGFGILGLPKQLFGVLLNLTGMHDQNDSRRTRNFDLSEARAGTVLEPE